MKKDRDSTFILTFLGISTLLISITAIFTVESSENCTTPDKEYVAIHGVGKDASGLDKLINTCLADYEYRITDYAEYVDEYDVSIAHYLSFGDVFFREDKVIRIDSILHVDGLDLYESYVSRFGEPDFSYEYDYSDETDPEPVQNEDGTLTVRVSTGPNFELYGYVWLEEGITLNGFTPRSGELMISSIISFEEGEYSREEYMEFFVNNPNSRVKSVAAFI